jgi:hypothetical protein
MTTSTRLNSGAAVLACVLTLLALHVSGSWVWGVVEYKPAGVVAPGDGGAPALRPARGVPFEVSGGLPIYTVVHQTG